MDRKYDVITLGEILLRLSTPINGRLAQGDTLMKHLGGAELNIASEIGQLGLKTAIISKIPNNLLAAFIKNQLNASRVSENYLIEDHSDDSRVGIYYYEYGSYPRKPRVVYVRQHSSFNNIIVSLANSEGQIISWSSAGKMGFRGSKKNTPYAAQMAAQDCAKIAFDLGLRKVKAYVKGPGNGRESAIRTIHGAGIEVTEIIDVTPLPHNGCRPPKRRRV